jgi:hypothetical protein
LKLVATDAARYIDPSIGGEHPNSGLTHDVQSFGLVDPIQREFIEGWMEQGYTGTKVHVIGRGVLRTYQDLFRVGGLALAVLVVLTLAGMLLGRGALRLGTFLFGTTALLLYLVPVAVLSYEVRYGLPPLPLIVTSGTLGFAILASRRSPADFLAGEQRNLRDRGDGSESIRTAPSSEGSALPVGSTN